MKTQRFRIVYALGGAFAVTGLLAIVGCDEGPVDQPPPQQPVPQQQQTEQAPEQTWQTDQGTREQDQDTSPPLIIDETEN